MQAFSLFSVLFLALIVYHKMAFNAVISRLSAIYNHREQTLIIVYEIIIKKAAFVHISVEKSIFGTVHKNKKSK